MRRLATMAAASHALRLGPVALRPAQIALETPLSVVVRDLRPVLPGHVVVAPKRPVERYADLTEEEGDDLAAAIRHAQQLTPAADAFNVALKDGTSAGQPVAHVHAHVVPRVKGDLANNDEIYGLIDGWTPLDACGAPVTLDVPDDAARKPRSAEDMAAEAARYRRRGDPFPEPANVTFGPFAVDASQVRRRHHAHRRRVPRDARLPHPQERRPRGAQGRKRRRGLGALLHVLDGVEPRAHGTVVQFSLALFYRGARLGAGYGGLP